VDVDAGGCLGGGALLVDALLVSALLAGACLGGGPAGRSFFEERRKKIRSNQQRTSNEEQIRTAPRMRNKFASV
jgi:hypothetical protein